MTQPLTEIELIEPQAAIFQQAAPYTLVLGAQGSGKSHNIGVKSSFFVNYAPKVIGLIAANTYDQLSRATLLAVFRTWKDIFGWEEYHPKSAPGGFYVIDKEPPPHFVKHGHNFKSNNNNIYLANGAVIFTASLDNYKAIEGIEVGWAMLDETADTTEEAVTSVITGRLRQKGLHKCPNSFFPYCAAGTPGAGEAINPLYIFTKPAKVEWLNDLFKLGDHRDEIRSRVYAPKSFYYSFDGLRQVVIYSVHHNARNLPANFIQNRLELLEGSGLVGSHIYGDPFSKVGGEFVPEFAHEKHVGEPVFDPSHALHFSVDFNAKPYMTGLIAQISQGVGEWNGYESGAWTNLFVLDEYALPSPRNTAGHLAEAFIAEWGPLCDMGLFIYGDASGNNTLPVKGRHSYFADLKMPIEASGIPFEMRVPASNPTYAAHMGKKVMGRKQFVNLLFNGAKGVRVTVSPKCKQFLKDLEGCQEDADGRLHKKKNKDGVEERGHHLDAFQYMVCHEKCLGYLAKML